MLPDGFDWRPWLDGSALFLDGRAVAIVSPLLDGRQRICLHPKWPIRMRYVFRPDEARAVRYVEAWAAKWAAELRAAG